jgi:diadenosine tetraphosphate (Ap4A) HIT family hydrolase
MPPPSPCPFCARLSTGDLLAGSDLAAAFPDGFPVSPGHALVVPRRHVADYFDLAEDERAAVWRVVAEVKARLDRERRPAGYNVGMNVGAAGGQTVWHAHVHVIPRYAGDVPDPRGGVRWVLGSSARYWKEPG